MGHRTLSILVCLVVVAGCGSVSSTGPDAPGGADAPSPDAVLPACDPSKPFGAPVEIAEIDTKANEWVSAVTSDLLTIYVSSDRGDGIHSQVYRYTRASKTDLFGGGALVTELNDHVNDWVGALSPDDLTAFTIIPDTDGTYDLALATRASTATQFAKQMAIANVNMTAVDDDSPYPVASGALYMTSSRGGSFGIYRAPPAPGGYGTPVAIAELNTTADGYDVALTPDELTIYFNRNEDTFVSHRSTANDGFGTPTAVPELTTSGFDRVKWVSPDGCTVLFVTDGLSGTGGMDTYFASKPAL